MALKLINANNTERYEAKQMGKHLVTGRYYNADKTVEKFINAFEKSEELIRLDPKGMVNDPTVTGFKLFFHFAAKEGLLADEIYPNSASRYLKDIGDDYRYDLLQVFKSRLSELNREQPWIFHTIEGLREIYTNPWDSVSYHNSSNKIIINTYETLDHKVAALNRMWRAIYWDTNRGVMVLPENLREFSMSVYLLDMRVFKSKFKFLRTWETETIADITHQLFDISHCQFTAESGGAFFDTVTNMSVQESFNSFVIGYDTASVSGLSPTMTGSQNLSKSEMSLVNKVLSGNTNDFSLDTIMNDFTTKVKSNIDEYGESQASYFIHQQSKLLGISTEVTNLLNGLKGGALDVNELAYGNIQGAGLVNLVKTLGDTSFGSGVSRKTDTNAPSLSLDTKKLTV